MGVVCRLLLQVCPIYIFYFNCIFASFFCKRENGECFFSDLYFFFVDGNLPADCRFNSCHS